MDMSCAGCDCDLEPNRYLKCNACNAKFCFLCLKVDANKNKLDKSYLASLSCPSCMNVTRRKGRNDSTPARPGKGGAGGVAFFTGMPENSPLNNDQKTSNTNLTLDSISSLLDEKLSPLSPSMKNLRAALLDDVRALITSEIHEIVKQLKDEFTSTTDFIMDEVRDLKLRIVDKDKTIKSLETSRDMLRNDIRSLNSRLSIIEKMSRDHNVELQAVPENRNENVVEIFNNLCKTIGLPIADSDIRACRRVAKMNASSDRPRNILITLTSPRMRDNVLSSVHRYNKAHTAELLCSSHVGIGGDPQRIYVNEHLAPETKLLHSSARKFARDNGYKYVWIKYGQVYLRKTEDMKAICVKSVACLDGLA